MPEKTKTATAAEPTESLAARLLAGERAALARALNLIDRDAARAGALFAALRHALGRARVIGFTGSPGAGKSTLVSAVTSDMRTRGRTVGIVAVDPSSPLTGGAILGDRIRMGAHAEDQGVFVRSLAARGHLGGLSADTVRAVDLMDAAGFDRILVETVGAGQSEVEIAGLADIRIVVLAPGQGDEIQAIKAGILEIADILVVNKADLPSADLAAKQLAAMAALSATKPLVLKTSAQSRDGVAALVDEIEARAAQGTAKGPEARARLAIAALATEALRRALGDVDALAKKVARGEIEPAEAAARVLALARPGGAKD